MNKLKEELDKIAKDEGLNHESMSKLAGFKFRSTYSRSVGHAQIQYKNVQELCDNLGYTITFTKNK